MASAALTLGQWRRLGDGELGSARAAAFRSAAASMRTHNAYTFLATDDGTDVTGALAGIPFAVKDNIDVAGLPTTAGSPLFEGDIPEIDAGVGGVLRAAGAVVVGKTNMHELAFGVTSNNHLFGPVRNPLDPARSAGGSSGGSAATVALGTVPLSIGTDTGGSVLIPAAFCGTVGFRPSVGRYPADGMVNLSWTRDTAGVHARTIDDVLTVDCLVSGGQHAALRGIEGLRLGVASSRMSGVDPPVGDAVSGILDLLARSGATLVDVEVADADEIGAGPGFDIVRFEAPRLLAARLERAAGHPVSLASRVPAIASADVRAVLADICEHPTSPADYERARRGRWRLRRSYACVFDEARIDAILSPTCPAVPPPVGIDDAIVVGGRRVGVFAALTRHVAPGTVGGLPMISLPVDAAPGVGLLLEGRPMGDPELLAVAGTVSAALGG